MARLIRRTLTITIHEQWTFVWTPGQTNVSQAEEDTAQLSLTELTQQLRKLLGLPAIAANEADSSLQIFIQSPPKDSTDENTNP